MRTLIILNGDLAGINESLGSHSTFDLILACDGAANHIPVSTPVNVICGDFDSIDLPAAHLKFPNAEFISLPDQNSSDLDKAIKIAIERGSTSLTLSGAMGKRIDHTLGTISTLIRHYRTIHINVTEPGSNLTLLAPDAFGGDTLTFNTQPSDIISLLPLTLETTVTISGVKWPLTQAPLRAGTSAVSNRATETSVTVTAHTGLLALCHLKAD